MAGALLAAVPGDAAAHRGDMAASGPSAGAARHIPTVLLRDNRFSKRRVTVRRRGIVRFKWAGRNPHNVTGGRRASRTTSRRGFVYKRRFTRTTRLVCTIHPDTMRMTVRVRRSRR